MSHTNPVIYFEIPVHDMERAVQFYTAVLGFTFEQEVLDGYDMRFFPYDGDKQGITGALVKGDVYKPTIDGIIIYFKTDNIELVLQQVLEQGGKILYPPTFNEKYGFTVAEFEDSEGNRIALQQTNKL